MTSSAARRLALGITVGTIATYFAGQLKLKAARGKPSLTPGEFRRAHFAAARMADAQIAPRWRDSAVRRR